MYLSLIDIFDLFFRFAVIGQLALLAAYILFRSCNFNSLLVTTLIVCACSYLLLTPQIPNQHYGSFRGVLLFFTDLIPYVCWFYVCSLLKDNFHPKNWSLLIKFLLIMAVLWLIYFFMYLQGNGDFHQVNHVLASLITLHVLYVALTDINDDLVNARRKKRMLIVFILAVYIFSLLVFELTDTAIVHTSLFSLVNSSLIFLSVNGYFLAAFNNYHKKQKDIVAIDCEILEGEQLKQDDIPVVFQQSFAKLTQFIEAENFKQTDLTITKLALILQIPEHQLRELINQCLGFKNFSSFLNSYRVPAACLQFENIKNIRKPILSIALELGYGSIGPFNRAFKDITGKTPSQYRQATFK